MEERIETSEFGVPTLWKHLVEAFSASCPTPPWASATFLNASRNNSGSSSSRAAFKYSFASPDRAGFRSNPVDRLYFFS